MSTRISILLPVHNGAKYLEEALDSIWAQTEGRFELIVVNDASTDETATILERVRDKRLQVITHRHSKGIAVSLNEAMKMARGAYWARMDSDDVMERERLKVQFQEMERHPELGILGSWMTKIDAEGKEHGVAKAPCTDGGIRMKALLHNPFFHPTIFLRAAILKQHRLIYHHEFTYAQDYELWVRILRYAEGANLPLALLRYRKGVGVSTKSRDRQLEFHDQVVWKELKDRDVKKFWTLERATLLRQLMVSGTPSRIPASKVSPVMYHYLEKLAQLRDLYHESESVEFFREQKSRVTRAVREYGGSLRALAFRASIQKFGK